MARKTKEQTRKEYAKNLSKRADPPISEENYRADLIKYLNFHSSTDAKTARKWAIDYQKTRDKNQTTVLNRASDSELRSSGLVANAIMQGDYVAPNDIERVNSTLDELIGKYKEVEAEVQKAAPVKVPTQSAASRHIAEVEGSIDEFLVNDAAFSMKAYLISNNVGAATAKEIAQAFIAREKELKLAVEGKDPDLKEGYAHLGKVKLKRFLALTQQIIVDCAQQVVSSKTARKPRAKKEKPASVLVAKLKYLKEFEELKLTSEKPESIIGAEQVFLYDTIKRKIVVYTSDSGQKLGVKGTTITGFSVKESGMKTLRKPEQFLSASLAKKAINTAFKEVRATQGSVNGRTNENQIILKVFK